MYMYLSATLNLGPSFSNSAITQSVIQGTPNEAIAKMNYIMVEQTVQVHHTVNQHKQKQNNTTWKQTYNTNNVKLQINKVKLLN